MSFAGSDEWNEEHLNRIHAYVEGVNKETISRSVVLSLVIMQWMDSYGSRAPHAPTHRETMEKWERDNWSPGSFPSADSPRASADADS